MKVSTETREKILFIFHNSNDNRTKKIAEMLEIKEFTVSNVIEDDLKTKRNYYKNSNDINLPDVNNMDVKFEEVAPV